MAREHEADDEVEGAGEGASPRFCCCMAAAPLRLLLLPHVSMPMLLLPPVVVAVQVLLVVAGCGWAWWSLATVRCDWLLEVRIGSPKGSPRRYGQREMPSLRQAFFNDVVDTFTRRAASRMVKSAMLSRSSSVTSTGRRRQSSAPSGPALRRG